MSTFFCRKICIFKQKAMSELYDEIVDKIIENNVIDLVIENNTDTSLKSLLDERLQNKGYNMCIIREKYNVKNKEQRIKDMRGHLKRNILFKEKTKVKPNTDYGRFMKNIFKIVKRRCFYYIFFWLSSKAWWRTR